MLVLLDLDGTLTDPFEGISKSVAHALAQLGLPALTTAQQRAFIGPPLQDSFAALGLGPAGVEDAVALYRERFTDAGLYENRVYDGIPEALTALGAAGHTLAVATSKPTPYAERILDHFGLRAHLAHVSGASLDGALRHKADIIAAALRALVVPPADAVMVGDRAQDVLGARACQVRSIGVTWGYAEPGELVSAGADRVVATPAELVSVLLDPSCWSTPGGAGGGQCAKGGGPRISMPPLARAEACTRPMSTSPAAGAPAARGSLASQ